MGIPNEHINQFKQGQSGNPNGRPRKYVSTLKAQGYKLAEINDCIQVMMAMTIEELKDAFENPNATVLEKTIAAAIKRSIEKGSLYSIETLLSRVYGKPKESVDMDLQGEVTITMNLNNDRRKE
jgi:hypothetical protein